MVELKKRISASTLIEVIVAMIIITLITGMTSSFILQNFKKTNVAFKAKAFLLLDNEVELFEKEKDYTDFSKETDGYKIERMVSVNKHDDRLKTVNFTIMDNKGNLIYRRAKVIRTKDRDN
ncbi:MAG TPA: hypothetical protein VIH57_26105 [Bacteroidales bacterium]